MNSFSFHSRQAARRWEETKKTEWSTPKRQRTETDFPYGNLATSDVESILSPASSMGGVEEETQPLPPSEDFDRPDTPPLSQPMRSKAEFLDSDRTGSSARRNLSAAFEDQ